jgi:acyl-CoA thioester hydrolase
LSKEIPQCRPGGTPAPGDGLTGRLQDGQHCLAVRVYFEDTDFSGFVYHTSYLRWCERGRTEFLRCLGISHSRLLAGEGGGSIPCAFAVRRMSIDFLKPARIDDIIEVVTAARDAGKAAITLTQEIRRENTVLFRLDAQCVLVSLDGRLLRLPASIRSAMAALPKIPSASQDDKNEAYPVRTL